MQHVRSLILAACAAAFAVPQTHAQSVPPDFPLDRANAGFGSSVAVGDGEVFVGEPLNRTEGVVYVYRQTAGQWVEVQQLTASDGEPGDRFGGALALGGTVLLIGATNADQSRGAAYVFERNDAGQWTQTAKLAAATGAPDDALGRSVALMGDYAIVGATGTDSLRGAAYVFRRGPKGHWSDVTILRGEGIARGDLFGMSLAAGGDRVAVGAPSRNGRVGAVFVFRLDDRAQWHQEAELAPEGVTGNALFGSAIVTNGEHLLAGAPNVNRNQGAVYGFVRTDGTWSPGGSIASPDTSRLQRFGSGLAVSGDQVWISAPLAEGFAGAIHVYRMTREGPEPLGTIIGDDAERGDEFGGAFAVAGRLAAVGMSGDDFGEGTALVLERRATGWEPAGKVFSEVMAFDAITGGDVACEQGKAAIFNCQHVDIVSFLPREQIGAPRGARLNDIWGWTDPATGKEYAIVGLMTHATFVDVSDPSRPVFLGTLPRTEGSPGSTWRDIKVYNDHAFIVADGAGEHGMQVFDLRQLRTVTNAPVTFSPTARYDGISSAHNIVINEETGFAFSVGSSGGGETCGGGLHMINIQDPSHPTFAGCFAHEGTGRRQTGYSHDAQCVIYRGPDEAHRGKEICFGANETALSLADVTDKTNPVALSTASYPNVGYTHQGWFTDDHRYIFTNDELDELNNLVPHTRTLIWDVRDLDDPVLVKEFLHSTGSTDHNLYIRGRYLYEANNSAGLRILDISDPENPVEVGFFDPVPWGEDEAGFDGTWSVYPFFESGMIVVSSRREGLFVLRHRQVTPIP